MTCTREHIVLLLTAFVWQVEVCACPDSRSCEAAGKPRNPEVPLCPRVAQPVWSPGDNDVLTSRTAAPADSVLSMKC